MTSDTDATGWTIDDTPGVAATAAAEADYWRDLHAAMALDAVVETEAMTWAEERTDDDEE